MALPTTYNTGTATVINGSPAVTGHGTTWLTSGIQAGDFFWAAGQSVRILSVNSNTSLSLAYNWPGPSRAADLYEIVFTPESGRVLASTRAVLDALVNGNVAAIAALATEANKFPYYTGQGVADLADITAHARSLLALSGGAGKFLASSGANAAALRDIVGNVAQVGGVPTGAIVEMGATANGDYARIAGGLQVCFGYIQIGTTDINAAGNYAYPITFPAAFSSQQRLVATPGHSDVNSSSFNNSIQWGMSRSVPTSGGTFFIKSTGSIPTTINVFWIAVGRWHN